MKSILVHEDAEEELFRTVEYYENKVPGLGLDLEREISNAFVRIQETPNRFKQFENGTRRYLLEHFPYSIYYFEYSEIVWIVAIAHSSRKPYYWKNRI